MAPVCPLHGSLFGDDAGASQSPQPRPAPWHPPAPPVSSSEGCTLLTGPSAGRDAVPALCLSVPGIHQAQLRCCFSKRVLGLLGLCESALDPSFPRGKKHVGQSSALRRGQRLPPGGSEIRPRSGQLLGKAGRAGRLLTPRKPKTWDTQWTFSRSVGLLRGLTSNDHTNSACFAWN